MNRKVTQWNSYRIGSVSFWFRTLTIFIICSLAFTCCMADEIVLVGGDVIHGNIVMQTYNTVVIVHDDLGRLRIPKKKIKSINVPASETDDRQEEEAMVFENQVKKLDTWSGKMKEKGWSFSADVSLDGSYGNTDEQALRFGMHVGRTQPKRRSNTDFSYYNKVSDGTTSDNKASLGYTTDFLKPESRWFWFYSGRYDFDEFESWEHRVSGHTGPGYNLYKTDAASLDTRVGVGARKEWQSENDDIRPEGHAGLSFKWKITRRQSFDASTTIYPVLSDTEDYRTRSTANWRFLIDREMRLSFLIGLFHEHQSIVDPGKDKNDTRIFSGIQYGF
ncbi:MAG: DUF481 domain-containing protein [Planctomycetota bacterium]